MRGYFRLWVHHSGRLVLAIHIFPLAILFLGCCYASAFYFIASLLFTTPLFEILFFNVVNVISSSLHLWLLLSPSFAIPVIHELRNVVLIIHPRPPCSVDYPF